MALLALRAPLDPTVVDDAIRGDRGALRAFVASMTPVIQARAVRGLLRRRPAREHCDIRQEVEDMTQEVFGALFAHDARGIPSEASRSRTSSA